MRSTILTLLLMSCLSCYAQESLSSQFSPRSISAPEEESEIGDAQRFSWSDRSSMQFHGGVFQSLRSNLANGYLVGIGFYVSYETYYGNLRFDLIQETGHGELTPSEKLTVVNYTMGKDLNLHDFLIDYGAGIGYISGVKRGRQLKPGDVPPSVYTPYMHERLSVSMIDFPVEAQIIYRPNKRIDLGLATVLHLCPSYTYLDIRLFAGFGS